jgi:hypothetical protein
MVRNASKEKKVTRRFGKKLKRGGAGVEALDIAKLIMTGDIEEIIRLDEDDQNKQLIQTFFSVDDDEVEMNALQTNRRSAILQWQKYLLDRIASLGLHLSDNLKLEEALEELVAIPTENPTRSGLERAATKFDEIKTETLRDLVAMKHPTTDLNIFARAKNQINKLAGLPNFMRQNVEGVLGRMHDHCTRVQQLVNEFKQLAHKGNRDEAINLAESAKHHVAEASNNARRAMAETGILAQLSNEQDHDEYPENIINIFNTFVTSICARGHAIAVYHKVKKAFDEIAPDGLVMHLDEIYIQQLMWQDKLDSLLTTANTYIDTYVDNKDALFLLLNELESLYTFKYFDGPKDGYYNAIRDTVNRGYSKIIEETTRLLDSDDPNPSGLQLNLKLLDDVMGFMTYDILEEYLKKQIINIQDRAHVEFKILHSLMKCKQITLHLENEIHKFVSDIREDIDKMEYEVHELKQTITKAEVFIKIVNICAIFARKYANDIYTHVPDIGNDDRHQIDQHVKLTEDAAQRTEDAMNQLKIYAQGKLIGNQAIMWHHPLIQEIQEIQEIQDEQEDFSNVSKDRKEFIVDEQKFVWYKTKDDGNCFFYSIYGLLKRDLGDSCLHAFLDGMGVDKGQQEYAKVSAANFNKIVRDAFASPKFEETEAYNHILHALENTFGILEERKTVNNNTSQNDESFFDDAVQQKWLKDLYRSFADYQKDIRTQGVKVESAMQTVLEYISRDKEWVDVEIVGAIQYVIQTQCGVDISWIKLDNQSVKDEDVVKEIRRSQQKSLLLYLNNNHYEYLVKEPLKTAPNDARDHVAPAANQGQEEQHANTQQQEVHGPQEVHKDVPRLQNMPLQERPREKNNTKNNAHLQVRPRRYANADEQGVNAAKETEDHLKNAANDAREVADRARKAAEFARGAAKDAREEYSKYVKDFGYDDATQVVYDAAQAADDKAQAADAVADLVEHAFKMPLTYSAYSGANAADAADAANNAAQNADDAAQAAHEAAQAADDARQVLKATYDARESSNVTNIAVSEGRAAENAAQSGRLQQAREHADKAMQAAQSAKQLNLPSAENAENAAIRAKEAVERATSLSNVIIATNLIPQTNVNEVPHETPPNTRVFRDMSLYQVLEVFVKQKSIIESQSTIANAAKTQAGDTNNAFEQIIEANKKAQAAFILAQKVDRELATNWHYDLGRELFDDIEKKAHALAELAKELQTKAANKSSGGAKPHNTKATKTKQKRKIHNIPPKPQKYYM